MADLVDLFIAPDGRRLRPLTQQLITRAAPKFDMLPFTSLAQTYKLATFSSVEDMEIADKWGLKGPSSEWVDYKWFPIAERNRIPDEQLREYNQAIFINRSIKNGVVPDAVRNAFDSFDPKNNTILVQTKDLGNRNKLIVFSTPNATLLAAKARTFASFDLMTEERYESAAKDLRNIGNTFLIMNGSGPSSSDKEGMAALIGRSMREKLRLPMVERSDTLGGIRFDDMQNANDAAALRQRANLKYVWVYTVLDYIGTTTYKSGEKLIREEKMLAYEVAHQKDDPEPRLVINSVGGGRKDEEDRKKPIFEREHREWERRRSAYEDHEKSRLTSEWEREITQTYSAKTRGILRLMDIQDSQAAAKTVWEIDCEANTDRGPFSFKRDTVVLRLGGKPRSMETPANSEQVPADILRASAVTAADRAIRFISENAWLPDGSEPQTAPNADPVPDKKGLPQNPAPQTNPNPGVPAKEIKLEPLVVAEISGRVLTITGGTNRGILVGDIVQVVLATRKIVSPTSGEVLSERVTDGILFRVTAVDDKTADCELQNALEGARLVKVQKGLVVKTWHPMLEPKKP